MKLPPIIDLEAFIKICHKPNVKIFDVSNHKQARSNYANGHLEGAIFVDVNTQLADIQDNYAIGGRHPLPTVEQFGKTLAELSISKDSHIIIYDDNNGANAAARFWWMLTAVGHSTVQVLNGGLGYAKQQGVILTDKITPITKANQSYAITDWQLATVSMNEVDNDRQNLDCLVIDVRDQARYDGKVEPIDTIAGHIPKAINVPFSENLDSDGRFLQPATLRQKYETIFHGVNPKNIIVHCGSGVTACHTLLALAYAGFDIPKLYVGSWSEWSRNNKPIATSATH